MEAREVNARDQHIRLIPTPMPDWLIRSGERAMQRGQEGQHERARKFHLLQQQRIDSAMGIDKLRLQTRRFFQEWFPSDILKEKGIS